MIDKNGENGSVMVEAVIIFPMVLMAVMALLYLGLFKLQEAAMLYQVQRVASEGSKLVSSPGYARLAENGYALDAKMIDWSDYPENIEAYYQAYHESWGVLYRELLSIFGSSWVSGGDIENFGERVLDTVSVLAVGNLFQTKVELNRSFFGTNVVVEVAYQVRTPAALRYFDLPDSLTIKQGAYRKAVDPAGFMRNVDLAADAVVVVSEKLGVKEDLDKIIDCFNEVRDFLF